jgi:hypothetical protein
MWKIRQAIANFMYNRYGIDKLYWFLFALWAVLSVLNLFLDSFTVYLLELAVIGYSLFRVFSRNIYARQKENMAYLKIFTSVKGFFSLSVSRLRDICKKRYRRCKHCKAVLRLPIKRGTNNVCCPKCRKNFKVTIII